MTTTPGTQEPTSPNTKTELESATQEDVQASAPSSASEDVQSTTQSAATPSTAPHAAPHAAPPPPEVAPQEDPAEVASPRPSSVRYRIRHSTSYNYADSVSIAHNEARLIPRNTEFQEVHSTRMLIEPTPTFLDRESDYYGNCLSRFALEEEHGRFVITADSDVTVHDPKPPDPAQTPSWDTVVKRLRKPKDDRDLAAYELTFDSPYVRPFAELTALAAEIFAPGRPVLEAAIELTSRIHADLTYDPKATTVATPLAEVVEHKRGVCQDFAHFQLSCLRSIGLAARYVSGYLRTYPPEGQKRLEGADASHAWVSLYVPDHGWIDLDPTNDMLAGLDHVVVGWGRDFGDLSPLKGVVLGGGAHKVSVAVDVMPLSEMS